MKVHIEKQERTKKPRALLKKIEHIRKRGVKHRLTEKSAVKMKVPAETVKIPDM